MKPTILALLVTALLLAQPVKATTYYLLTAPPNTTNWNNGPDWTLNADGSGATPSTFTGNTFDLNGHTVGSPSGAAAFGDGTTTSMILDGGTLNLRNGGLKTIPSISATGGTSVTFNSATTLADTTFTASGGTTTFTPIGNSLTLTLNLGTLSGAGNLLLGSGSSLNTDSYIYTPTTGTLFTGNLTVGGAATGTATLSFGGTEVIGGNLIATDALSRIVLATNQNITVDSLTLNGTALATGAYTYAQLQSLDNTIFSASTGGEITVAGVAAPVPEPSTYALLIGGIGALAVLVRRRSHARTL